MTHLRGCSGIYPDSILPSSALLSSLSAALRVTGADKERWAWDEVGFRFCESWQELWLPRGHVCDVTFRVRENQVEVRWLQIDANLRFWLRSDLPQSYSVRPRPHPRMSSSTHHASSSKSMPFVGGSGNKIMCDLTSGVVRFLQSASAIL